MSKNKNLKGTLDKINDHLENNILTLEINQNQINEALIKGTQIRERKELIHSNIYFLMAALSLFLVMAFIVIIGYISLLLIIQVIMVVLAPLAIPFAIRKQLKGGVL